MRELKFREKRVDWDQQARWIMNLVGFPQPVELSEEEFRDAKSEWLRLVAQYLRQNFKLK